MIVRLLEVARHELDDAIAYYNGQAPGLGDALLLETVAAIERIQRFPDAWHRPGGKSGAADCADYTDGQNTGAIVSKRIETTYG